MRAMHPGLTCLPDLLLQHIGRCSELRYLKWAIDSAGLPSDALFLASGAEPALVSVGTVGVDLLVQQVPLEPPCPTPMWGVQGIRLISRCADQSRYWRDAWPFGLSSEQAHGIGPSELLHCIRAEVNSESLLTDRMLCAPLDGRNGQDWLVLAQFGGKRRLLQSMSILRQGPWEVASVIPAWDQA